MLIIQIIPIMKEMIDTEKTSNILIGVGLVGLLAYGYMLIFSDISPEDLKYSVLACTFAAFLPCAITIRKITTDFSIGIFWGIVIIVAAIFSFVAYSMMKATEDGILFDLFAVISSEGFRWLYLSLLVISTIFPFIWEKGVPYVLAISLGVIIPVFLYTILILVAIWIGCYVLSLFGKSNNTSSSLSSLFTSTNSGKSTQLEVQNNVKPTQKRTVDNKRYAYFLVRWGHDSEVQTSWTEAFPVDMTHEKISEYMKRAHVMGDGTSLVSVEFVRYTTKDSVNRLAFEIYNK